VVFRKAKVKPLGAALGVALAAFVLVGTSGLAGEGNANYLGILSSTAPTGYTPSPTPYSLSLGQNLLTFQFNVTNLTSEAKSMSLQMNLDHITVYQGQDVSDGQPGVVSGAVVDGQFNETLATELQDPNPTFTTLSIAGYATQTMSMSRTLPAGQCGYYQVDVFKQGQPTSDKGLVGFEIRVLGCGTPNISTTPSPTEGVIGGSISDTATVTGGLSPSGTVTFGLFSPGDTTCSGTNLVAGTAGFVNVPLSAGSATSAAYTTTQTGIYNWEATYNGDTNNSPAMSACGTEQVTVGPASPVIPTIPSPSSGVVGVSISDSAAVTGGFNPTGSVTFSLYGPGDTTCAGPNLVASLAGFANVPLSGATATSAAFPTPAVGTYNWTAVYSGDSNNNPATSACSFEQVVVRAASPRIATVPSPTSGTVGVVISDSATVSGGYNPTGTVTFALFGPGDTTCSGTNLVTGHAGFANVPLSGGSAASAGFKTTAAGTYNWTASYSGDSNNNPAVSVCSAEQVTVTKPLGSQGCTPGFWKNPKHFSLWTNFTPTQLVGSVFNVPAVFPDGSSGTTLSSASLAAALAFQGGSDLNGASQILLRAAVAGLLNSTNAGVAYPFTTAQIISNTNAALKSGNRNTITNLATQIDNANNGGCPLS